MGFSYFFRDLFSLELSVDKMLELFKDSKELNIWNAGCSFGAEPFTVAILLAERMGHFAYKKVKINATDIDAKFGNIINERIYNYSDLKRIPKEFFKKYFEKTEKEDVFKVSGIISDRITFIRHDLLSLTPHHKKYNLIVCKNVLLHLNYQQRIEVIKMYHEALLKDGLLIMEHTQPMPEEIKKMFNKISSSAQFFQKK